MDEAQMKMAEELLFSEKKKSSFVKGLYFGRFESAQVMPYPRVSQEEEQAVEKLVSEVKAFVDHDLDPVWIDRHSEIPDKVIQGLAKIGVLGLTLPKEHGGRGMSQYAYCRVMEIVAARCGSTALFVNADQSIGLKALLLFGTPEQQKLLRPLAQGEWLAAFALTEPNAGSDASGVQTRAVFDPIKNVYVLNGRKQWITNGSIAKVLTVMAQTEVDTPQGKQDKITAFLIRPEMPGFKVTTAALDKVGMRGSKTANLEFQNVEVPAANILGPKGGGLRVCLTVLDFGRTTFGATCTGVAKFLVEQSIQHVKSRYQFKRPLASFGLVKQKIAAMAAYAYAMESATYLTAGLIDAGIEDFMLEAAILKVFTSESAWAILYDTMQLHGGRSFFTDAPFERIMRDSRLNMIGEGSNEVLRVFIAVVGMRDVGVSLKEGLDACKHPFRNFAEIWKFKSDLLKRLFKPKIPIEYPELSKEAKRLASAVRKFGWAVIRVLARYRQDVVEQQIDLNRIATCAIALYTTTAVISRLNTGLKEFNGDADKLGQDLSFGKLYCQLAMQQFDEALTNLFHPLDKDLEMTADKLTGIPTYG